MTSQLLPSGISLLDEGLKGGFPKPANFLVIGEPLSSKRELGMLLLNGGLEQNEAAIYVSTSNTAEEVRSHWERYGLDPAWEKEGRVKFVDCYSKMLGANVPDTPSIRRVPSILDYSKLSVVINEWCAGYFVQNIGVRMLLDSLSSFLIYSSLQTVMRFLHIFLGQLRRQNVLGLFLLEEGAHEAVTFNQLKTFSNGAIKIDSARMQLEGYPASSDIPLPNKLFAPEQKMPQATIPVQNKSGEKT
ncbi:MAG: RAD55 family ATPase [Candidatus Bathyarchaeota archaeon]|nr:RAD55 family ATPase [Candidatus Bathyarchaeota archaeon]